MSNKTWRRRWLNPLARLVRGDVSPRRDAAGRNRVVLNLEELETRLTPSSATLQFNTASETINQAAGTFSIPVTLTGAVAPVVTDLIPDFNQPNGEAFDATGNLYVANGNDSTVNKVTPAGAVSTFASGFSSPDSLAFDAAGNLYVADGKANTVSKVTPAGVVSPFAAGFSDPLGLAFDAAGNLYVANHDANTVSKVTPAGVVSTFASGFNTPDALAFDAAGNLYVANHDANTVSKVTPAAAVSPFASGFTGPAGLAFDAAGNLYVSNYGGDSVSKVTPAGVVSYFDSGFSGAQGLAFDSGGNLYIANDSGVIKVTPAGMNSTFASSRPIGLNGEAFDAAGNLYVADHVAGTVSKVTPAGVVSTFASGLSVPENLTFDAAGNLYVTERDANTVQMVTAAGVVSNFASGFNIPDGLAFDAAGNLYVANEGTNTVSKVTSAGVVSTFAAGFTETDGLAFDAAGNLYVADGSSTGKVSKVTPAGVVSTFASGFEIPQGLAFDTAGNLYVADSYSSTLSKVTPAGVVSIIASGLNYPNSLAIDAAGNLYFTHTYNGTVSEVISTVTVPYTLGGTAVDGTDYSGVTNGTLTFPTGQTTENITGTLLDDPGANKTLTFTLGTSSSNASLGSPVVNTLTIDESSTPVPILTSISPAAVVAGSSQTTITLTGSSFVNGSTADFNGAAIATTFVSATQLTAVIPSSDLTTVGAGMITVVTAGPGGGTSAAQTFTVKAASPTTAVLKSDGSLWDYSPTGGMQLLSPAGTIRAVSTVLDVHGQTDVFAIVTNFAGPQYNNTLWEYASGGWSQQSSGAFAQISPALDANGESIVFGLVTNGSLWQQSHTRILNAGWSELSGNGTSRYISAITDAAGNAHVYVLVTPQVGPQYANTLWEHTPAGWRQDSSGQFSSMSAGLNSAGQTVVYGILTNGNLWEQNPAFGPISLDHGWQELSGSNGLPMFFTSVQAGGPDKVFGIAQDSTIWEHTPTTNTHFSTLIKAMQISATETPSGTDEVFITGINNTLYEYSSAFAGSFPYEQILASGVAANSTPE